MAIISLMETTAASCSVVGTSSNGFLDVRLEGLQIQFDDVGEELAAEFNLTRYASHCEIVDAVYDYDLEELCITRSGAEAFLDKMSPSEVLAWVANKYNLNVDTADLPTDEDEDIGVSLRQNILDLLS